MSEIKNLRDVANLFRGAANKVSAIDGRIKGTAAKMLVSMAIAGLTSAETALTRLDTALQPAYAQRAASSPAAEALRHTRAAVKALSVLAPAPRR